VGNEEGVFLSPGYVKLPVSLEPLRLEEEVNLLLDLIRELNEKFILDLDEDVELMDKEGCDTEGAGEDAPLKKYLVVGNSHASRLALALEDLGFEAKLILAVGWASDAELNNSIVQQIKEEVELCDGKLVVVFMLYDNEVYVVEDGDVEQTAQ
jgi:hypothetical protein